MFYLSKLLGSPVKDVENKSAGTLHDLVVSTRQAYPRVTAVGIRRRGKVLYAPWDAVSSFEESGLLLRIPGSELAERDLGPAPVRAGPARPRPQLGLGALRLE